MWAQLFIIHLWPPIASYIHTCITIIIQYTAPVVNVFSACMVLGSIAVPYECAVFCPPSLLPLYHLLSLTLFLTDSPGVPSLSPSPGLAEVDVETPARSKFFLVTSFKI
jgi:hypothetical protein